MGVGELEAFGPVRGPAGREAFHPRNGQARDEALPEPAVSEVFLTGMPFD